MVEIAEATRAIMRRVVIALVPACEFVVLKENLDKGKPVGLARIELRSPDVKEKVTCITNPREPLITIDHIIDRGRMMPASFVSSAVVLH
jgi:hypothetical protein